jgi:hypothetical protein
VEDEIQQRLGTNQAVFREINEGIERGQWPGEEDSPVSFRCECARLGCNDLIELSVRTYERVRENPRWFIVVPGHQHPELEVVVDAQPGYLVVEKIDQAGVSAEETDPRS